MFFAGIVSYRTSQHHVMAASAAVEEVGSWEGQHARQMRRIVDHLRRVMENLGGIGNDNEDHNSRTRQLIRSAHAASQNYRQEREDGVKNVLERLRKNATTTPIDIVCMQFDGVCSETSSDPSSGGTLGFKRQYINRNVPCVIRGLDRSCFANVTSQWRISSSGSRTHSCKTLQSVETTQQINTEWFRRFIGNNTLVPVRYTEYCDDYATINNVHDQGLDEEGRARECKMKQMSLDEWISKCQNQRNRQQVNLDGVTPTDRDTECHVEWYLKDWHLLQFLANQDCDSTLESPPALPLYATPSIFERDILNRFLERCCDDGEKGGDYKFVYWGPAGSRTSLHSDVLHSFSWSYNVVGMKKWIFHVPLPSCTLDNDREEIEQRCFEVIQYAGETIFVPSTWKHEVVNIVETLSINHNWITSANVDQAWICLQTEIAAIEEEVQAWGVIPTDDFEAKENMLRGCIGLDCTMFTLMVLLEIVDRLLNLDLSDSDYHGDDKLWDCAYSMFRLRDVLADVLRQASLVQRMTAGFRSEAYALEVESFANDVIRILTNNYPD